jgi:hypothetical protein
MASGEANIKKKIDIMRELKHLDLMQQSDTLDMKYGFNATHLFRMGKHFKLSEDP